MADVEHRPIDFAKIRWYANEIENTALSVYAGHGVARLPDIDEVMKAALRALRPLRSVGPVQPCPVCWEKCPDNSCQPSCPRDSIRP